MTRMQPIGKESSALLPIALFLMFAYLASALPARHSTGPWRGLALGLTFTATLLAWRFNRLSRRDLG